MALLKTLGADVLALHIEKQQALLDMAANVKKLGMPAGTVDLPVPKKTTRKKQSSS